MSAVKKRRGDRRDARLIRRIDDVNRFAPYLMRGRNESAVYFSQRVRVEKTRMFLKELNRIGEGNITMFHLVLAAIVRTIALWPQMNRFVVGNRIYSHDDITISFTLKQRRSVSASEAVLRIQFDGSDTLLDVARKAKEKILTARRDNTVLGEDKTISFFLKLPRFVINGAVSLMMYLNRFDLVPKSISGVDPMSTSAYLSNMGNYNISPPFHHLYEWGTSSLFLVMGNVHSEPCITGDHTVGIGEVIEFSYTLDERIGDGYYFTEAVKTFGELIENPEPLLSPPGPLPVDE